MPFCNASIAFAFNACAASKFFSFTSIEESPIFNETEARLISKQKDRIYISFLIIPLFILPFVEDHYQTPQHQHHPTRYQILQYHHPLYHHQRSRV